MTSKKDTRVGDWAAANNVEFAYTPTNSSWLNRIEAQFTALRYFALDGTDHASHKEQGSMVRRYIIWRNKHAADERLRVMNAILYVDRTGIPWRYLPHDFPPHQTVYGYFARWEADGIFDQLTGLLRGRVRQAEGRASEPSACLIDSQSIKTSATVHLASQGIDPAKKIIGRKRHIVTDTLGLLLAVAVTAASVHDSAAGSQLLTTVRERHPTVTKAWADNGYKTKAVEQAAHLGIDLEIVQRDPRIRGFHVQPRRWVIERTLGWLMHHRRLARDYETHAHRSAAMIQLAAINLMTRRLTHETTTNWRNS